MKHNLFTGDKQVKSPSRYYLLSVLSLALLLLLVLVVVFIGDGKGSGRVDYRPEDVFTDTDMHENAVNYEDLEELLGPVPRMRGDVHVGAALKFLGNHYWQLVAVGLGDTARELDVGIEVQAAKSEVDYEGQKAQLLKMMELNFDGYIVAPQSDSNLSEPVVSLREQGVPVVHLMEIGEEGATFFVGVNHIETGRIAGKYFLDRLPDGGKVLVVKGLEGVLASDQRVKGFEEVLAGSDVEIVGMEYGDWDLEKALGIVREQLKEHPDLSGIYCANDTMALGAVEAVQHLSNFDDCFVVGTDGTEAAKRSVESGELAATVDLNPRMTGMIALEVLVRLLDSQPVPPVVYAPQSLVTLESVGSSDQAF